MKLIKLLVILLPLVFVAACTTTKVQNMPQQNVPKGLTANEVKTAIYAGGKERGWTMKNLQENNNGGLIEASISRGQHLAVVNIPYTASEYSIQRKDSAGFEYDANANTIKRHYNWWIGHLNDSIQANLHKKVVSG